MINFCFSGNYFITLSSNGELIYPRLVAIFMDLTILRDLRKMRKVNQSDLAKVCGINQGYLSSIERFDRDWDKLAPRSRTK